jgi:hypothetical protein
MYVSSLEIRRLVGVGPDINICARSFSEFVDIHSCYSKKKIGDCKSDQENSGPGESVTARDPAVLMKAALRESCFGLFTSETSSG